MMGKQIQKVEMLVQNIPGVLGRVVAHIRNEGWNIKRLLVDETEQESISQMEMDIEGTNAKLALVAERMLRLDCVTSITINGETRGKASTPPPDEPVSLAAAPVPRKPEGALRILACVFRRN